MLLGGPTKGADCENYSKLRPPKIRVARKVRTDPAFGVPMVIIHASIARKNLNESDLITLACSLEREYAHEEEVFVRIFDNFKAARTFHDTGEGNSGATTQSLRAEYAFTRHNREQTLRWRPYPESGVRESWNPVSLAPLPGTMGTKP